MTRANAIADGDEHRPEAEHVAYSCGNWVQFAPRKSPSGSRRFAASRNENRIDSDAEQPADRPLDEAEHEEADEEQDEQQVDRS